MNPPIESNIPVGEYAAKNHLFQKEISCKKKKIKTGCEKAYPNIKVDQLRDLTLRLTSINIIIRKEKKCTRDSHFLFQKMNELSQHIARNWMEQCKLVERFMYARDTKPEPAAAAEAGCQLGGHSGSEASATDNNE